MAIKTKKITDLGEIVLNGDNGISLNDTDFYLLGCKAGITGKVATSAIVNSVSKTAMSAVETAIASIPAPAATVVEDESVKEELNAIKTSLISINQSLAELSALKDKVAALESFVQALQKDGYLTLKEIQRAAADACPICTHTHETSAE